MIDPATVVQMLRAEGEVATVIEPGGLLEDVDGRPLGVGEPTVYTARLGAPLLSAAEWQATARFLLEQLDAATEGRNDR